MKKILLTIFAIAVLTCNALAEELIMTPEGPRLKSALTEEEISRYQHAQEEPEFIGEYWVHYLIYGFEVKITMLAPGAVGSAIEETLQRTFPGVPITVIEFRLLRWLK